MINKMPLFCIFSYFCAIVIFGKGTNAYDGEEYVGCYEINNYHQFIDQYQITDNQLTPKRCAEACYSKNYAYAALEKNQCRCGDNHPPEIAKTRDVECDYSCPRDGNLKCGGTFKISIYKTGINAFKENTIPARMYFGCYVDSNDRVFRGVADYDFAKNSPLECQKMCYNLGYKLIGLQAGTNCFCGDPKHPGEKRADSECKMLCPGDNTKVCGDYWRNSVYSTGITDIPLHGRFMGCFKNTAITQSKSKNYITLNFPHTNSNRRCLNVCDVKGFKYSAAQNRSICVCMNEPPPATSQDDNYACNVEKCLGDRKETCGSIGRMKVFKTRRESKGNFEARTPKYLGCYVDQSGSPIWNGQKIVFTHRLTPQLCIEICRLRGFFFSGVENGEECFCGQEFPPNDAEAPEYECSYVLCSGNFSQQCGGPNRIAVYDNGLFRSHPAYSRNWYEGCFENNPEKNQMLQVHRKHLSRDMLDVSACKKFCMNVGFTYFGLSSTECFCGDGRNLTNALILGDDKCQTLCPGDSMKNCGGSESISVYRTGLEVLPIHDKYRGCSQNDGTLLNDRRIEVSRPITDITCVRYCYVLGFLYSGVEQGTICRCGDSIPNNLAAEDDIKCTLKCSNSDDAICEWIVYMSIYRTSALGSL